MSDCVFCKIIARTLPGFIIDEYDSLIVSLSLEHHPLIVPKAHLENLLSLDDETAARIARKSIRIARALRRGLPCDGIYVTQTNGACAGQDVFHYHMHLYPKWDDGVARHRDTPKEELTKRIRDTLEVTDRSLDAPSAAPQLSQPTIESPRLILRPFALDDAPDVLTYASSAEVARYVTWEPHSALEDSRRFINWINSQTCHRRGELFWGFAITLKETGRVIGSISFKNPHPFCGQIDYALGVEHQGQGLMTEAAQAVFDWARAHLPEIERFQASCDSRNRASARVMERIGMKLEGIRRKIFVVKGKPIDLAHYALVRDTSPS